MYYLYYMIQTKTNRTMKATFTDTEVVKEITVQGKTYRALEGKLVNGQMKHFALGPNGAMYVIWIGEFTEVRSIITGRIVNQFTKDTLVREVA